jgi:hypothetical protein
MIDEMEAFDMVAENTGHGLLFYREWKSSSHDDKHPNFGGRFVKK